MLQRWGPEDFLSALDVAPEPADFWQPETGASHSPTATLPPAVLLNDFWEPTQPPQQFAPTALQLGRGAYDFWDPIPHVEVESVEPILDWSDGIALPLYDARASESPFRLEEAPPSLEVIARRRARWLLSLLDVPTKKARWYFANKFEELFDEYPHLNTFRALTELAVDGASADEILTAFQLRQIWADNPIFWTIRRKGYPGPFVPDSGEKQLGWTRAIRLANLAKGLPAERVIDHDWYAEWLRVPYGSPLFWSFLEYATARLESFSRGVLAVPDILASEENTVVERSTKTVSIDGMKLGSFARTGLLLRSGTDLLSSAFEPLPKPENRQYQAEAAE